MLSFFGGAGGYMMPIANRRPLSQGKPMHHAIPLWKGQGEDGNNKSN